MPRKRVDEGSEFPDLERLKATKPLSPGFVLEIPDTDGRSIAVPQLKKRDHAEELLKLLGFDPTNPDCWGRGFRLLARLHYKPAKKPKNRSNKNAQRWTRQSDWQLYRMVNELRAQGKTLTEALKSIAANDRLWGSGKFPAFNSARSTKPLADLRYQRLVHRWKHQARKFASRRFVIMLHDPATARVRSLATKSAPSGRLVQT